jgi:ABC-type branched-subunit amino acid transport system ATPase component
MDPVLSVEALTVSYGPVAALQPISFQLAQGGLALVLGPNGAGKSSLVRALAGAVRPQHGQIRLAGEDVTRIPAYKRVKQGIALVPEGRGTLPGLSVLDNLDLGWHSAPPERRRSKTESFQEITALFPVLGQRLQQDCKTLSGGEMQMLAIARALLSRPRVLLLDEPSLGLAPQAVARVYRALAQLNQANGLSMVLVEQKSVNLGRLPDTSIVLHSGHVMYQESNRRPAEAELSALYLGLAAGAV